MGASTTRNASTPPSGRGSGTATPRDTSPGRASRGAAASSASIAGRSSTTARAAPSRTDGASADEAGPRSDHTCACTVADRHSRASVNAERPIMGKGKGRGSGYERVTDPGIESSATKRRGRGRPCRRLRKRESRPRGSPDTLPRRRICAPPPPSGGRGSRSELRRAPRTAGAPPPCGPPDPLPYGLPRTGSGVARLSPPGGQSRSAATAQGVRELIFGVPTRRATRWLLYRSTRRPSRAVSGGSGQTTTSGRPDREIAAA